MVPGWPRPEGEGGEGNRAAAGTPGRGEGLPVSKDHRGSYFLEPSALTDATLKVKVMAQCRRPGRFFLPHSR